MTTAVAKGMAEARANGCGGGQSNDGMLDLLLRDNDDDNYEVMLRATSNDKDGGGGGKGKSRDGLLDLLLQDNDDRAMIREAGGATMWSLGQSASGISLGDDDGGGRSNQTSFGGGSSVCDPFLQLLNQKSSAAANTDEVRGRGAKHNGDVGDNGYLELLDDAFGEKAEVEAMGFGGNGNDHADFARVVEEAVALDCAVPDWHKLYRAQG